MRCHSGRPMPRSGTGPISKAAACRPIRGATSTSTVSQQRRPLPMRSYRSAPTAAKAAPAPPPTSPTSCSNRRSGFTLTETVAAMLIVELIASLAVTLMPGTGRAGLKAVTLESAALLRRERLGAILTGRERHVSLDGERRVLLGDGGGVVAIPRDVTIDLFGANDLAERAAVVRFHPDGASSGAVLRFSREKAEYEIRVNWYTGGVSIEAR